MLTQRCITEFTKLLGVILLRFALFCLLFCFLDALCFLLIKVPVSRQLSESKTCSHLNYRNDRDCGQVLPIIAAFRQVSKTLQSSRQRRSSFCSTAQGHIDTYLVHIKLLEYAILSLFVCDIFDGVLVAKMQMRGRSRYLGNEESYQRSAGEFFISL